jgi:hypothetical protein
MAVAVWLWGKTAGGKRLFYLLLALLAARVAYLPAIEGALLLSGWIEQLGRAIGTKGLAAPVHYALGCFVAALVSLLAFVLLAAAASPRRAASIVAFVLYAGAGVLALSHPDDRVPVPHPFAKEDLQPASEGADYLDVAEEGDQGVRTRVLAGLYGIADAGSPGSGWSGIVRAELHARFRAAPDASLRARVASVEGALTTARRAFRTSPRTPPG